MPVKIARSAPRPSFGLPELLVAIHISRQSCCKARKARIFTPVRESSGESRLKSYTAGPFSLPSQSKACWRGGQHALRSQYSTWIRRFSDDGADCPKVSTKAVVLDILRRPTCA
jgi:hypothetical protein